VPCDLALAVARTAIDVLRQEAIEDAASDRLPLQLASAG
jgi:hypothetical protein